jgi:alpha-1,2-mannosyltransferase
VRSAITRSGPAPRDPAFGLDFIAFYTAGAFVNDGRYRELYDLRAVHAYQHDLAKRHGVELGDATGPWWNPPFYAWVFSPLARLPFGVATFCWIALNVASTAVAAWLLVRMLPAGRDWRTWALVPVLIGLSVPFIHCVTHGQSTGTSLLLLTLTVAAWRAGRGIVAGLIVGLLFYKPQLATLISLALIVGLGWRPLLGIVMTGSALLLVTLLTLPGSLGDFIQKMPANLHHVQLDLPYLWERHATLAAFWRLLLQGRGAGDMRLATIVLTGLGMAAVGLGLVRVSPLWRWVNPFARESDAGVGSDNLPRDRFIAAAVAATPLLMPFYFDYDLLLLAVPAVLIAGEMMGRRSASRSWTERGLLVAWPAFYGWMLINADVAEATRVNLGVPLLACLFSLLVARALPRRAAVTAQEPPAPTMLMAA